MTLREVNYLANCYELQEFVDKYNLRVKLVDNQFIYLISKCLVIRIHGLVVEDFFYFDLYSIDLKKSSTLNVLLSDFDSEKLRSVYQSQIHSRTEVLIKNLQGSKEKTLRAEQYFFTMLQLMDELLGEIMSCKKEIREEYWNDIFDFKAKQLHTDLEDIVNSFTGKPKEKLPPKII